MKSNRFLLSQLFFPAMLVLIFSSCSGLKTPASENDDAYYSSSDLKAAKEAAARAAEKERRDEEAARAKSQALSEAQGGYSQNQPDYVNPEYKSSGNGGNPNTQTGNGDTYITNNYYRSRSSSGIGYSPYTSLGYNWMYPGYSGITWGVSSFWGPMWAGSGYSGIDYGFGYSPYYSSFYNPYSYNPYAWYNPWYYRPFYRYRGYNGSSYWDNYNYQNNFYNNNNNNNNPGGGGVNSGGGRIKTNLPLGGTGTGVYGAGPSGGRTGGREAVSGSGNPGSNIHSGTNISTGTQPESGTVKSSFWRRNGSAAQTTQPSGNSWNETRDNQNNTGTQNSGNTGTNSFWRGSQRSESQSSGWATKSTATPSRSNTGVRTQTQSSGWGSGTSGGRSKTTTPSTGSGPSGGRRR